MTAVITSIPAATNWVQTEQSSGKTVGLVPTMGALHQGHLSLIRRAKQSCDRVIVSIFVNPLQFGAGEDYGLYPRQFDGDLALLQSEQTDAVFYPEIGEMYPSAPVFSVNPGKLGQSLCGASRPGHFQGVATVLAKLFHIVPADRAFFGQKDAQQTVVVKTMVRELNFPLQIEVCPTVREPDGLAMSSRNVYLNREERANATILYRSLKHAQTLIEFGTRNAAVVEEEMSKMLRSVPGAELDYARVVDPDTLEEVNEINRKVLIAIALRLGKTRLIDNLIV